MTEATVNLPSRAQAQLHRWVGSLRFWALFVAIIMALPIVRAVRTRLPPPLKVLGTVPAFSLTDQYGHTFGSQELEGKVWVANFIFTRCPTICPRFTEKMGKLQDRGRNLGPAFHLVSFSVDPTYDTPERLLDYAQHHKVSPRMWTFLTGSFDALKRTVVDGLKVSMGREGPDEDFASIFHGTHFVLVDQKGQIRGYYASTDDDAVETMVRDIGLLANRGY